MTGLVITLRLDVTPALVDLVHLLARTLAGAPRAEMLAGSAPLPTPPPPVVQQDQPPAEPPEPEAEAAPATEPPAALTPEAPADAPGSARWTPERSALLDELYAAGVRPAQIVERLNALPGLPVTAAQVSALGGYRRRKQRAASATPEGDASAPEPSPPDPTPPRPVPAASAARTVPAPAARSGPAAPQVADYQTIHRWAAERGLASVRSGMDLDAVNAKRRALGLPVFVLASRAGRAPTTPAQNGKAHP